MLSHSHKFIFVHVYKTAGSSIREALRPYQSGTFQLGRKTLDRLCRTAGLRSSFALHKHASAQQYLDTLRDRYWDFFSFAFVRHPLDWQVSLYHYTQQTPEHHEHALVTGMTFDDYIMWRCNEMPCFQIDLLTDREGKVIVDFIGKVESIADDFNRITEHLGIEASLPHVNRSQHDHYLQYYTPATQAMVIQTFRRDFERLGYNDEL